MRFMVMVMATKESEAGTVPKPEAFAETKELVAGFSIIQVKSLEEAIEWVKCTPNIFPNGEAEFAIRKVMDLEDFGEGFTPNPEIEKVKIK